MLHTVKCRRLVLMMVLCCVTGLSLPVARELSVAQGKCLREIEAEVVFITSRIGMINDEYEQQLKKAELVEYRSGEYSTIALLDNTIRKYRLNVEQQVRDYPHRYRQLTQTGREPAICPVEELKVQRVGIIHDFEAHWSAALERARRNAAYFSALEGVN